MAVSGHHKFDMFECVELLTPRKGVFRWEAAVSGCKAGRPLGHFSLQGEGRPDVFYPFSTTPPKKTNLSLLVGDENAPFCNYVSYHIRRGLSGLE